MATVRLSVLGPTTVWVDDQEVVVPPRQRSVLAALALAAPKAADTNRLIRLVWGDDAPKSARASLHNAIGQLRGVLGDGIVETEGQAYRLGGGVIVDAAEGMAASSTLPISQPPEAFASIGERWAAQAYPALASTEETDAVRSSLAAARSRLTQRHAGSLLVHDRPAEAVALLRSSMSTTPATPTVAALLALALHRTGDPVEASRALDDVGTSGRHELIDSLRTRILADDDRLRDASIVEEILVPVDDLRGDQPVVGRDDEIHLIGQAVKQGAVVVRGEGGAGKTVVIEAAEPALAGVVVRTLCSPVPTSPYSPVLDMLEQLTEHPAVEPILGDIVDECDVDGLRWAAPSLEPWLGSGDTPRPEFRREQADRALVDFFSRLGSALTLTLIVDDYHRAPRTSQQLFKAMAGPGRVRLVIGTRPDADLALPSGVIIDLRPLDAVAVTDLVALHLGAEPVDVTSIADELVRLTGGNAFFVESMIRHSAASGAFRRTGDTWELALRPGLPVTVEAAVMEQLDDLSHRAIELVEFLAVSSEPMAPSILAAIDPRLPASLPEAVDAGVVRDTAAGVQVAHDLVAEAVQAKVSPVRLIDLHDELAEAFENSDEPNRIIHIARHRFGARSLDPIAAVAALRAAGELERSRSSAEFAIEHLVRAREVLDAPGSPDDLDLAVLEGLARRDAVDIVYIDVLYAAAEQAIELGLFDLAARALIGLGDVGQVTTTGGGDPALIALVERALVELDDPVLRVRLRVNTLAWFALGTTWSQPQMIWREALAEAEQLDNDELRWEVMRHVDWGVDGPDQLEQRLAVGRELIAYGETSGDLLSAYRGHFAAWGSCVALGDAADLAHHHARIHDLEPNVHAGRAARLLAHRSAGMALLAGRLDEADGWIDKALALPNPFSPGWDFASMATVLLPLRLEQGRADELLAFGQAAAAEHSHSGVWQALLARCAFDSGDLELAAEAMAACAADDFALVSRDQSFLAATTLLTVIAVHLEDRAIVAGLTRVLLPYRHLGVWCGQGSIDPVGTSLGRLALFEERLDDAVTHLEEALAVANRVEAPLFRGRLAGLAHRLQANGAELNGLESSTPNVDEVLVAAETNGWVALHRELDAIRNG